MGGRGSSSGGASGGIVHTIVGEAQDAIHALGHSLGDRPQRPDEADWASGKLAGINRSLQEGKNPRGQYSKEQLGQIKAYSDYQYHMDARRAMGEYYGALKGRETPADMERIKKNDVRVTSEWRVAQKRHTAISKWLKSKGVG